MAKERMTVPGAEMVMNNPAYGSGDYAKQIAAQILLDHRDEVEGCSGSNELIEVPVVLGDGTQTTLVLGARIMQYNRTDGKTVYIADCRPHQENNREIK